MRVSLVALSVLGIACFATGCSREPEQGRDANSTEPVAGQPNRAAETIALNGGDGRPVGSLTLSADANGVTMKIDASAIAVGTHGVHLHEKGVCEGPKFETAGAHWNPANKKHGRDNPQGAHLGDLANFDVPESGTASTTFLAGGVTMSGGANALADADGTSLVIHAKADDYKTDPSGNSGDRVACAVIAPPSGR